MDSYKNLQKEALLISKKLIDHRQHIHANPELSFHEHETARYVVSELKKIGLSPKEHVGTTGVVTEIGTAGKVVAIRVDMDALPITEKSAKNYCSKNQGVMHACGHDAHTAMGLGAAMLLAKNPPKIGRVRFLFQPAEEDTNNSGKSGATLMIEDGALSDVSAVLSLHVFPDLEAGKIALREGPLLAACDKFVIKIQGRGGHGAYPELCLDPIVITSHVVQAIQTIVSRKNSALEPLVITVGGIKSNTHRPNIISDYVELTGTVRYFYKQTQVMVRRELEEACKLSVLMGGNYQLDYIEENPAVVNDKTITNLVKSVAGSLIGEKNIDEANMQMGGDDFSFLSAQYPSCYIFLGAQIAGDSRKLHTETFDIDESCLPIGTSVLAASALAYLNN